MYQFFDTYPNAKNWLKWYLNPVRAVIFFEACKETSEDNLIKFKLIDKDTNSQENMGKIYKLSFVFKKKANVMECVRHAYSFYSTFVGHRNFVSHGGNRNYGGFSPLKKRRRSSKYTFTNDGRAPDTTDVLLGNVKMQKNRKNHYCYP